jgi:predicted ribosomally synthesized peptide with nif11-like leader
MMSAEQLKSFLESASTDQDLRTKTQSASTIEELVAIAEQAGFSVSSDDFKAIELDDNELASVSGGVKFDEVKDMTLEKAIRYTVIQGLNDIEKKIISRCESQSNLLTNEIALNSPPHSQQKSHPVGWLLCLITPVG